MEIRSGFVRCFFVSPGDCGENESYIYKIQRYLDEYQVISNQAKRSNCLDNRDCCCQTGCHRIHRRIRTSESHGCPAVADPGADVVAIAQRKGYKVVPLVGPSSILMSVMGSGFNGQSFAFHGYLPIDASQRTNAIKKLEGRIYSENQTQLFIETPYRNNKLAEELIRTCRPSTKLCIASNITCEDEYIHTRPVKEWAGKVPDLSKKPTIFLIYK